MVENAFLCDHGRLVGKGFIDCPGRARVNENFGYFDEGVWISSDGQHFAGAAWPLVTKAVIEHGKITAVLNHEGVRSKAAVAGVRAGRPGCGNGVGCRIGRTAARTVTENRIAFVTGPGLQVFRSRHASLLVPPSAFAFWQYVGLRVVIEVVGSTVQHQVRTIETAVLPCSSILRKQDWIRELPMEKVVGGSQADHRRAFLVASAGISVPGAQVFS